MRTHWFSLLLVVACLSWVAGAWAADEDCSNATPSEAKALAHKAATQVETLGFKKAFQNFMDPDGDFFPRDLYVFVVDLDGKMWVNGAFPQAIGSNVLNSRDTNGVHYIQEMLRIARARGEGQVEYMWINPCTGEYTDKLTFFKRVGRFVVAVGAYRGRSTHTAAAGVHYAG